MKTMLASAAISLCLSGAVWAEDAPEGRLLAHSSFVSVDANENGFIEASEASEYGNDVFVSMDYDENGLLSEDEFTEWGFGFQTIAAEEGKELAYRTALRVVFSFWDGNADGGISRSELRQANIDDFKRSDRNGDGLMSKDEFLSHFSILVAIRAALKPE